MSNYLTVLAFSGGKDSTATLILALERGIQIDKIVTVLPDPFKKELDFIKKVEKKLNVQIEIIPSPTFEDYFFRKKTKGKYKGTIYGFPMMRFKTCARILKWQPMDKWAKEQTKPIRWIFGICSDELKRIQSIKKPNVSYLNEHGITQDKARELCYSNDLLNPLYDHFERLGCVRCPKQGFKALSKVVQLEPEKWQWLIDHDSLSPVKFKPNMTIKDLIPKLPLTSITTRQTRLYEFF